MAESRGREIVIAAADAGTRLDRYLRKLLRTMPLSAIYRRLRSGAIRVDGRKRPQDHRLQAGERLQLDLPEADTAGAAAPRRAAAPAAAPPDGGPEPRVVYRDQDLLVVDKPAGFAVQPGSGQRFDLVAWLDRQGFGRRTATFAPAPAHRLDRGTSGLLAIGLSPPGLRGLTAAFRIGTAEKVYFAVVHGAPEPAAGTIALPLRDDPGAGPHAPRTRVDAAGQPARTDYAVVHQGRRFALLRLVLHTGRRHQIRAHLAALGHPIAGDTRYGSSADTGAGFLLHAGELAFPHPRTGQRLHCHAPLPPRFRQLVAAP